jgi:hypothetical protein
VTGHGVNPRFQPGETGCLAENRCLAEIPREYRLCAEFSLCVLDYKARTGMLPQNDHARDDPERRSNVA